MQKFYRSLFGVRYFDSETNSWQPLRDEGTNEFILFDSVEAARLEARDICKGNENIETSIYRVDHPMMLNVRTGEVLAAA